jgi:hypothetical protein
MARWLYPSSFECDCGHESHFFERTVRGMGAMSQRRRKAVLLGDAEDKEHTIEFENGEPTTVLCPQLGRCPITGGA